MYVKYVKVYISRDKCFGESMRFYISNLEYIHIVKILIVLLIRIETRK